MDILNALNWRHASKRMNGNKVPQEKLDVILESIRLAPSSLGLQPYNVLVISNRELLEKIKPLAFNQPQITEASHLLIFVAWSKVTEERVNAFISNMAKVRAVPEESLAQMRTYGMNFVSQTAEENFNWTSRQAYIALGTAMVAAAGEEVDATPMEGFNPSAIDELLGLPDRELRSVAFLTLGYRDVENDWLAGLPKVRTPKDVLFIEDKDLVAKVA